jgi:hypothetical integral membrane protein (TIGR02206 family)
MNEYLSARYTGAPFQLFGMDHVIANALILLVIVVMGYRLRNDPANQLRERIRWGLVGFLIANQLAWDAWQYFNGLWSVAYSLPLQICTLSGVLCAIMVATRQRHLYELLYFWGLAGAGNGLITPDLLIYGFPHFRFWLFFTAHGGIIIAIAFMTLAYGYRPTWRSFWRAILITNLYMAAVMVVNVITGGNYMYIARTPEFPTVIDYMGPWPWYIIGLELIGLICFLLVYLPWAISDRWAAAQAKSIAR